MATSHIVIDGTGFKQVMVEPKSPLEYITPQFLEGMAEVLLDGAQKYEKHQWAKGMSWETVMGGILRHLNAFRSGEEMDSSGKPHLAHAACGLMFLHWFAHGPSAFQYEQFDDRAFGMFSLHPKEYEWPDPEEALGDIHETQCPPMEPLYPFTWKFATPPVDGDWKLCDGCKVLGHCSCTRVFPGGIEDEGEMLLSKTVRDELIAQNLAESRLRAPEYVGPGVIQFNGFTEGPSPYSDT